MINWGKRDSKINPGEEIQPSLKSPTIRIMAVLKNENVSLQASRFPTGEHLRAFISRVNAGGSGSIEIGTVIADADGEVFATFPIPPEFKNTEEFIFRLDSESGYFASHEFRND